MFYSDVCLGVVTFGPPIAKKKMMTLIAGTRMHEFLEINRMAFSDILPKNSESRVLSVCLKIIKKE